MKKFHGGMHKVDDGTAYFDRALSYGCKMFMKLTAGFNAIKLFLSLVISTTKIAHLSVANLSSLV